MKKNVTIINIISSIILQFFTIIYGFIIPKIIIVYFGSEVNGLVSSITQFLSYISLLEGGVTAVIIAKLYKPLVDHDDKKISSIIVTANSFYKKIGMCFIVYSCLLAIFYPIIFNKFDFNYIYIFVLTLILSISLIIQYMLSLGVKCLLSADKKIYIISFTQTIIIILNTILGITSIKIYPNIHMFKFLTAVTYFLQPLIFGYIVKKHYTLNFKEKKDMTLINDRWSGFANNIAYFIHNSTDITILTIFTNLTIVSVYSVYNLVTSGIKALIGAINNGVFPTIGHLYAKDDKNELLDKFNIYEVLYLSVVFVVLTVTAMLITPFVKLYVGTDIFYSDYEQPMFGLIIVIAMAFDLSKIPHVNLSYSANKFKELTFPCFVEAFINIIISIIFVNFLGLIGVAIGTLIAMIYRLIFQISFTKKIIGRPQKLFWKSFVLMSFSSLISFFICKIIYPLTNISLFTWITAAFIYLIVSFISIIVILIVFYRKLLIKILKRRTNNEKFD